MGAGAAGLAVPDTSPAIDIVERGTARLTVTVGQAWQAMLDLPSLMSARMGAGALAITVAGAAGVPVVANTMNPDRQATQPVPAQVSTTALATTAATATSPTDSGLTQTQLDAMAEIERIRAEADRERRAEQQRLRRQRDQQRAAARAKERAQAQAPAQAAPSPAPPQPQQSTPAASPAAQPQLEFGP